MASLGTKPADWDKYVKNNPQSGTIDYVVENNVVDAPVYKNMSLKEVVMNVSTGQKLKITTNNFTQIGRSKYANVRIGSQSGLLRITNIRKPTGKGGADAEQRTLDFTIDQLRKLEEVANIGRGNSSGIDLLIPGIGMRLGITSIEKVPNRIHGREAKSDFVLKNTLGKGVVFISHKDGSGPTAFGQYGGVSEVAGNIQDASLIYNNPEVQAYLTKLYRLYDDAVNGSRSIRNNPFSSEGRLRTAISYSIQSSTLINQSVYGPDFGGDFGPDNVHLIGQGQFIFNPLVNSDGDVYFRLSFSGHMSLNGQVQRDFANDASGYRATIITTYRDGRPTQTPLGRVPLTRTAIYPKAYRGSAINIDDLL
jgi:hypothetical protein